MRSGDPIAFYEIAATLIPLLLFGGVVLDSLHPPELAKDPGDTDSGWDGWKAFIVVSYLPLVGFVVIVAEVVALDTVVTGEVDSFHAKFVGLALILGMAAVVLAVWLPWMVQAAAGSGSKVLIYVLSAVTLIAGLWLQPWVSTPVSELAAAIEAQPPPSNAPLGLQDRERVWLEHLIATSDYRIDKLQAEAAASTAGSRRVRPHLETQKAVLAHECGALKPLTAESRDGTGPAACPE